MLSSPGEGEGKGGRSSNSSPTAAVASSSSSSCPAARITSSSDLADLDEDRTVDEMKQDSRINRMFKVLSQWKEDAEADTDADATDDEQKRPDQPSISSTAAGAMESARDKGNFQTQLSTPNEQVGHHDDGFLCQVSFPCCSFLLLVLLCCCIS